jgi:hypothetical protein
MAFRDFKRRRMADIVRPSRSELISAKQDIETTINNLRKSEYNVYIRLRQLPYLISQTSNFWKKIEYTAEQATLNRLHAQLVKKISAQYSELRHYNDLLEFMH